jgi:hypothetical protein
MFSERQSPMASIVSCPSCNKKLQLGESPERGGPDPRPNSGEPRLFKCPSCGTKFRGVLEPARSGPGPSDTEVMKGPLGPAESKGSPPGKAPEPTQEVDAPKRKGKRKRQRKGPKRMAWLGEELFILAGIKLTPARLGVAGLVLIVFAGLAIAYNPFRETKPTARGMEHIQTRFQLFKVDSARIPQGTKLFLASTQNTSLIVIRPNPQGDTMLVTLPISEKALRGLFGDKSMIATLKLSEVQLQCDGQTLKPICFLDAGVQRDASWYFRKSEDGNPIGALVDPPFGLHADGQNLSNDPESGSWKVQRDSGMMVEFTVDTAADKALLTWDKKSTGWKGTAATQNPSKIGWGWELMILFPKPANVKDMKIKVWNLPPQALAWEG